MLTFIPPDQRHEHLCPRCKYRGSDRTRDGTQRDWYACRSPVAVACRMSSEPPDDMHVPATLWDVSPFYRTASRLGVIRDEDEEAADAEEGETR